MKGFMIRVGLVLVAYASAEDQSNPARGNGVEARVIRQTVMLSGCGYSGAGVVVGEDGASIDVLTSSHLVCQEELPCNLCANMKAWFFGSNVNSGGKSVPVHFVDKSEQKDLAVISISKKSGQVRKNLDVDYHFKWNLARDPRTMSRGDHLFVVGALRDKQGWFVPAEPFFLARVTKDRIEFGPTGAAYPGVSGGPLCSADGEIIGIVGQKANEVGLAEPITGALDWFKGRSDVNVLLFAERRFPVLKPHYSEISADAIFPSVTNGLSGDGPGVGLHVAHGISRLIAAAFDATILYARGTFPDFVETQQILIPSGGLQVQPFADLGHRAMHEALGGVYLGGGLGWGFVTRSVQGSRISVKENSSSLMLVTEAGYRWPLPTRGIGIKVSYRVYQPIRSQGLERANGFAFGLYGVFR
jgi:Trypsin-like peptidase domain